MKQLLIAGVAGAAVTAYLGYKLYQMIPSFPEGIENTSRKRQYKETITRIVFRIAVTAERLHIIDDSLVLIRKLFLASHAGSTVVDLPGEKTVIAGVPVVIFRKDPHAKDQKAIVYFHGGGYALGSTQSYAPWTARLANRTGAVVISVEYRLAPKHPYPAAVEDCLKVTKAVFDSAEAMGIDRSRIAVSGDSAGANLASVVALQLCSSEQYRLKAQILFSVCTLPIGIVPMPSVLKYNCLYPIPADWYLTKYAGQKYTRAIEKSVFNRRYVSVEDTQRIGQMIQRTLSSLPDDIRALVKDGTKMEIDLRGCGLDAAAMARLSKELKVMNKLAMDERNWLLLVDNEQELAKLPPAFFSICAFDMRRDEGLLFYSRLRSVGVPVVLSYLPTGEHIEPVLNVVNAKKPTAAARKGLEDAIQFTDKYL